MKKNKTVIIMRGLPGSGKSMAVGTISTERGYKSCFTASADHFFMKDGVYKYDPLKTADAHNYCMKRFLNEILLDYDAIFVDNTNIKVIQFDAYVRIARALECEVEIVEVHRKIDQCVEKNVHMVPGEVIQEMAEEIEPSPWGIRTTVLYTP